MASDPALRKFKRRTLVAGILGSAAIIAAAAVFIREGDAFFRNIIGRRLLEISWILSRQIDADAHATIRTPADMESDAYRSLTALLEGVQRDVAPEFSQVVAAYTIRIDGGNVFLIVSPPADANRDGRISASLEKRKPVGFPYGQPPDEAMVSAVNGTPKVTSSFVTDRWGTWLTACSPLRSKDGAIDGAVCVDEDARDVRQSLFALHLAAIATAVIVTALFGSTLVGYLRSRMELETRIGTEKKLERALRRFEAAIENTPDIAIKAFDRKGTILLWNRACERIHGFTKEEMIGQEFAAHLKEATDRVEFLREIERAWVAKRTLPPREWTIKTKSGEERRLLSTMFPIIDNDAVVEIFWFSLDITQERATRHEIEKSVERLQAACQLMIGRETRVVELKREVNALCDQFAVPRHYGV